MRPLVLLNILLFLIDFLQLWGRNWVGRGCSENWESMVRSWLDCCGGSRGMSKRFYWNALHIYAR